MEFKIAVLGLGYVGLPLAVEFSKKYSVIGFDINTARVSELNKGVDSTLEVDEDELKFVLNKEKNGLKITDKKEDLESCNIYIVTVPTPVDINNRPLLDPLIKSSKTIGKFLKNGDIIIYESTVYPGVTEEVCAPILEEVSGLIFNQDFTCGYSPERINPGDKKHTITKIKNF